MKRTVTEMLKRLRTVTRLGDRVPHRRQADTEGPPQTRVVIDDEDFHSHLPVCAEAEKVACNPREAMPVPRSLRVDNPAPACAPESEAP